MNWRNVAYAWLTESGQDAGGAYFLDERKQPIFSLLLVRENKMLPAEVQAAFAADWQRFAGALEALPVEEEVTADE